MPLTTIFPTHTHPSIQLRAFDMAPPSAAPESTAPASTTGGGPPSKKGGAKKASGDPEKKALQTRSAKAGLQVRF